MVTSEKRAAMGRTMRRVARERSAQWLATPRRMNLPMWFAVSDGPERRKREMTAISYVISRLNGRWTISCNGHAGAPYSRMQDAVRDAMFVAELLERSGEKVDVRVDRAAAAPGGDGSHPVP